MQSINFDFQNLIGLHSITIDVQLFFVLGAVLLLFLVDDIKYGNKSSVLKLYSNKMDSILCF